MKITNRKKHNSKLLFFLLIATTILISSINSNDITKQNHIESIDESTTHNKKENLSSFITPLTLVKTFPKIKNENISNTNPIKAETTSINTNANISDSSVSDSNKLETLYNSSSNKDSRNKHNTIIEELSKISNSYKLNNYLIKSKIKLLNKEVQSKISNKVMYMNDLFSILKKKEIFDNEFNLETLINSSESNCSKKESLIIGILAKLSFDSIIFNPFGVSKDTEIIRINNDNNSIESDWKPYIVLMSKQGFENRLTKICYSESVQSIFIRVKFDEECSDVISILEENHIINHLKAKKNDKENQVTEIDKKISNSTDTANLNSSFLEKSLITSTVSTINASSSGNKSGAYSMSSLASKFSVDELNKIKSIIKFAKKNKITDKIYNIKGNITLEELIKQQTGKDSGNVSTGNNGELREFIKYQKDKMNSLESTLKDIQKEIKEIKDKIQGGNSNANSINTSTIGNTSGNTNTNATADISRLIASSSSDDSLEDEIFNTTSGSLSLGKSNQVSLNKPNYASRILDKSNSLVPNKLSANTPNPVNINTNNFSASKHNLRAKPTASSHTYSNKSPAVSARTPASAALKSPAPASGISSSFKQTQTRKNSEEDEYDDYDIFAP